MNSKRQKDQADMLRHRAAKNYSETNNRTDVDVFSLPSRKDTHKRKKKRAKIKTKYPLAYILLLAFIMIILAFLITPLWINWF